VRILPLRLIGRIQDYHSLCFGEQAARMVACSQLTARRALVMNLAMLVVML